MSDSPVVKSESSDETAETSSEQTTETQGSALEGDGHVGLMAWFNDLTWNEAHLFILGFYAGFVAVRPKPRHAPVGRLNWRVNQWYWKGAYILGYVTKAIVVGTVGLQEAVPIVKGIVATGGPPPTPA